jgi:RNA polymerase sigma-54 factor
MARLGLSQQQALGQQLQMLPRMLQSIELLQLPAQELEIWLREAAEGNEALCVDEPAPREPRESEPCEAPSRRGTREDSERHDEFLRNQPERSKGLAALLEEQLALLDLEPGLLGWVRLLVHSLDRNGYLTAEEEFLLREASVLGLEGTTAAFERALSVLQELEPRGIGARNAVEALVLQLDPQDRQYKVLCRLLREFLQELAHNKLPAVARALDLELAELGKLVDRLRALDPRPASQLVEEDAPPIRSDVVVDATPEGFEVALAGASLSAVRLEPSIAELAKDRRQPAPVRRYLRDKVDRARWIVDAVEQRRATLLRVAGAIFRRQRAFLEHGPGHLAPLRMAEVADELGLHVSTVSRAVAGKYAQTPRGSFPLRHFFQATVAGEQRGARDDVLGAVGELFAREDAAHPLSDDDVVELLRARGWRLARRTVAKYRRELGIQSSYRRRAY